MAAPLGEAVGETVGYRVRLDSKVGPRTRIEVVTDGIFLRMLQDDPVARRRRLRDLRRIARARAGDRSRPRAGARIAAVTCATTCGIIAMSATLDPARVSDAAGRRAGRSPAGRMFPVETRYLDREAGGRFEDRVAARRYAVRSRERAAARWSSCPASARSAASRSGCSGLGANVDVAPLYGDLSPAEQDRAIAPAAAGRAQGRAGDLDRRDQPDHRGRAHRDRWRADAGAALLAALGHDAAGDGAGEPGLGRPAARPRRPPRARHLLPAVDRERQRLLPLHAAGDPRRRSRAAGARARALGRRGGGPSPG